VRSRVGLWLVRLLIATDAYSVGCMGGLYEVEVEPEIRSWLADSVTATLVGSTLWLACLPSRRRHSASPMHAILAGKSASCGSTCFAARPGHLLVGAGPSGGLADRVQGDPQRRNRRGAPRPTGAEDLRGRPRLRPCRARPRGEVR